MGLIDWPSPYASNVAFFKRSPSLPNGRGSTRRFNIPNIEYDTLGLSEGDRLSIDMYDRKHDREISFEATVDSGTSNTKGRFLIPLRRIDLEPREFDNGRYHQVILRKAGLIKPLPTISPKRVYNTALFKRTPRLDVNSDYSVDSTLQMTIPKSQSEPLDIKPGDDIYVTMFKVGDDADMSISKLKNRMKSVNRSMFKATSFESGRQNVTFSIPSKRRRLKDYDTDDVFQVAVIKR